jgi:hypothetical protein
MGGKMVNIESTVTNNVLAIQTPSMMTWGIIEENEEGKSNSKFSMLLKFPNESNKTEATTTFLTKLIDFKKILLDNAVENSDKLFAKKNLTKEQISEMFISCLKYTNNNNPNEINPLSSLTIKVKIPYLNTERQIQIYDNSSNQLFPCDDVTKTPRDFVRKGDHVTTLLECGGIWFTNGKWGITWNMVQCRVNRSVNESTPDTDKPVESDEQVFKDFVHTLEEGNEENDEEDNIDDVDNIVSVNKKLKKKPVKKHVNYNSTNSDIQSNEPESELESKPEPESEPESCLRIFSKYIFFKSKPES